MYLVVRLRGTVNVPYWAKHTLTLLNLDRKFNATLIPETEPYLGMLKTVKDYVAWCKVDAVFIKALLEKRGRVEGDRSIDDDDIAKLGFLNIDDLAKALAEDKIMISKLKPIKPWFALAPPRGGFKRSSKHMYNAGGILGDNKELANMVLKMI